MPTTPSHRALALFTLFAPLLLAATAGAQANYFEGFENAGFVGNGHGPDGLIQAGWDFRNQSDPVSSGDWTPWNYSYQGRYALNVNQSVSQWQTTSSEACSWALLPAIPGQTAGDQIRFFYSSVIPSGYAPIARLEVRYSPSGGTNTGSLPGDVGDFSVLLADIADPATHLWAESTTSIPGNGRLAFRFRLGPTATRSDFLGTIQIDNLSVGQTATGPPLPGPGQTVHWTLAMSPITINEITTIVADGTVIVDPGVVVNLEVTATLTLNGDMICIGTPTQPVTLQGYDQIEVFGGLELERAIIDLRLTPYGPGSLTALDCAFLSRAFLFSFGGVDYPPFLSFERCTFDGLWFRVGSCILRLVDCTFSGSYCEIGGSSLFLKNVDFDAPLWSGLDLQFFLQPVWLDEIRIQGASEAALDLVAANVRLGPNVVLQNSLYPAQIGGGGFLSGSQLPTSGNTYNSVLVEFASAGLVGGNVWSDVGVPYFIPDFYIGGTLDLLPGVHVQLGPKAEFWGVDGHVEARGTADSPVVFEASDATLKWQGLQKFFRFENCVIDGGEVGARFNSATFPGYIDNCLITHCDFGVQNDAYVRKTRFLNNDVGSWGNDIPDGMNGALGANSFEGNVVGVQTVGRSVDARNNWWNHPSGANSPDNPGGQGDAASSGVVTVPFLTSEPDYDDQPPRVLLNRLDPVLQPGSKLLLTWISEDDHGIARHRIDYFHPLDAGRPTVVVDNLPGTTQAYEWTVPDIGFAVNGVKPRIRVTAIDAAGQEGWDASDHVIPSGDVQGTLTFLTDLSGPFIAGEKVDRTLCWDSSALSGPFGIFEISMVFGADRGKVPIGSTFNDCMFWPGIQMPFVSTDSARIEIAAQGTSNHVQYFYSEPFEIRHDARLGDQPPVISMQTPLDGDHFDQGTYIPVTWTASDDEGLSAFHIQASYDGGSQWHDLAVDLPAAARSYQVLLPPAIDMPDVHLRVVAVDQRFQNRSAGGERSFSIGPAGGSGWSDLGNALSGSQGDPLLSASGPLTQGSQITATLSNALPLADAWLVAGLSASYLPYRGGVLVPDAQLTLAGQVSATGDLTINRPVPPVLTAGRSVYLQYWIRDPQAVQGFAASNAVQGIAP